MDEGTGALVAERASDTMRRPFETTGEDRIECSGYGALALRVTRTWLSW
jgi:hypothetical protein